jgi:hypothetical protein
MSRLRHKQDVVVDDSRAGRRALSTMASGSSPAVLVDPKFIYRVETTPATVRPARHAASAI